MSKSGEAVNRRNPNEVGAENLTGLLSSIKATKDKPTTELITWIADHIRNTRDVLLEPDLLRQRAFFILIALRQSTRVEERKVFGQMRQFVYITDRTLYNWAISESHRMPERFA